MSDRSASQLWIGNIPSDLDEEALIEELRRFKIKPLKVGWRQRGPGRDGYGIAHFSAPEHAKAAKSVKMRFSNGNYALFRLAYQYNKVSCVSMQT